MPVYKISFLIFSLVFQLNMFKCRNKGKFSVVHFFKYFLIIVMNMKLLYIYNYGITLIVLFILNFNKCNV